MSKIEIEEEVLKGLQNDNKKLEGDVAKLTTERDALKGEATKVPALASERDTFKRQADEAASKLTTLATERDSFKTKVGELEGNVTNLTNAVRERDFIDALAEAAPHVERKVLRGMVVDAAEKKTLERYPEKVTPELVKGTLDRFKQEAPAAFSGKHVNAGGSPSGNGAAPKRTHIL
jgi:DNA repair exonuclease SbcCD ATPase subunit